jgi:hypothetical protein
MNTDILFLHDLKCPVKIIKLKCMVPGYTITVVLAEL